MQCSKSLDFWAGHCIFNFLNTLYHTMTYFALDEINHTFSAINWLPM